MKMFLKRLRSITYFFINKIILRVNSVKHCRYEINGFLWILNKGRIIIGSNFKANSGNNKNPIGGDTILRLFAKQGAEILIGTNVGISNSSIISHERIIIGDNVLIGGGCKIWDTDFHSVGYTDRIERFDSKICTKPIEIKEGAFIGGCSIILKGSSIGKHSVIGAGSVVAGYIPDYEIWAGNPARFIKKIDEK